MTSPATQISVVIPVFKNKDTLQPLIERLTTVLNKMALSFEVILVEDGCPQNSWEEILRLSIEHPQIKALKLSRNFGQHPAILAGLGIASGDYIVVMDGDLQDLPEEIPKLFEKAREGYDIVFARRAARRDSFFKKAGSQLFYKALGYLTDTPLDPAVANFGVYSRKAISSILQLKETLWNFSLTIRWVGFSTTSIEVEHGERFEGASSYTLGKLISLAIGLILAFSNKPLRLIIQFGFITSLLSASFAIYILLKVLVVGSVVPGWASVMVSLWFLSGLLIMILGIVGEYVGRTFNETKQRPIYIIDKTAPEMTTSTTP